MAPHHHTTAERCVEAVLSDVGREVVLGIPIAIGKPNHFVNALYARALQDRSIQLKIFTGLTFVKPAGGSELERRFSGPIVARLFGDYPDLDYATALLRGKLPPNIEVHEFFFQAGAFLNSRQAQRAYTSLNYTHVAKKLIDLGINVLGQLVAKREASGEVRYSLSSNTDITLDILPLMRERLVARAVFVAQVNTAMPFMEGDADVPASTFDHVLEAPAYEFAPFAPPKQPVALADYAAAIHTATLVKDGGTIQLGIGAFSDALAQTLVLRQKKNADFKVLAQALGAGRLHPRLPPETEPFGKGLYGATELFVDGYLALYRAGILKRRAFNEIEMQHRADAGELTPQEYDTGALLHAGFFFGDSAFYEALRTLTENERRAFRMTAISFVNQLYGGEALKRAHRRHARFINSAMMATLLGDVISDQLADGRVVSGVGGQYNFVAQAHELEDGRSIIELHASRMEKGRAQSNIRWSYGHCTIPRHLRDIVVTEYGAADLRGLSDRDTVAAMLNIADSRFQDALLKQARDAGKIERRYDIPRPYRSNTPDRVKATLLAAREAGLLPEFPFGSSMTAVELALLPALTHLQASQYSPLRLARLAAEGAPWTSPPDSDKPLLRRMKLDKPASAKDRFYAALLRGALRAARG